MGNRLARCLLGAALLSSLSACFQSDEPLTPATEALAGSTLVGSWRCTSKNLDKGEFMTANIRLFDERQLLAELIHSKEPPTVFYRLYPTRFQTGTIWNVSELETTATLSEWNFVRLAQPTKNTLEMALVEDDSLRGKTEAEKRKDLRLRATDPQIFGDITRCTRS